MFPLRSEGIFPSPVRRAENSAMSAKISKRHELKIQLVSSEDEIFSRRHMAYFRTALLQVARKTPTPLHSNSHCPSRSDRIKSLDVIYLLSVVPFLSTEIQETLK